MKKPYHQQNKAKNKTSTKKVKKTRQKTHHDPLFGDVPIIDKSFVGHDGRTYHYTIFDPNYKPKIPFGAVPGNVQAQVFYPLAHMPKYFYVDEKKDCIQCKSEFIFSAKEQQYWFEVLKFNFHSRAIRCHACRKKNKSENLFETQLFDLHQELKVKPNDPDVMIAIAETICLYYEKFQKGKLTSAVTLARKAMKTDPTCFEGLYWEAMAQQCLNKPEKAKSLFLKFIDKASTTPRCKHLIRKAKSVVDS